MIKNKSDLERFFEEVVLPQHRTSLSEERDIAIFIVKASLIMFVPIFVSFYFWGPILPAAIFLIGGIILYKTKPNFFSFFSRQKNSVKEQVLQRVIPEVFSGFTYSNIDAVTYPEFQDYNYFSPSLVSGFHSEDAITGSVNGRDIRVSECFLYETLEQQGEYVYNEIFSGLLTEYNIDIDPSFKMALTRKNYRTSFLSKLDNLGEKEKLEEISLSHPTIDEQYVLLTNNASKSHTIFQPRTIEKILSAINDIGKNISISISGGKISILSQNNYNLFEMLENGKFNTDMIWEELESIGQSINYIKQLGLELKNI